jgi:hypothetical protein
MKKIIVLGLFCSFISFSVCAQEEALDESLKSKPNILALTNALMGIATDLLSTLPDLIKDIAQFPSLAQADALELQKEMIAISKLTGEAKQKGVQQLFVQGVNLTILVANILNKIIAIIASIGPLAVAIDANNGAKVNSALQLTATIMQMISKINIAMKNSIIADGTVTVTASAVTTPQLDPIPSL